MLKNDMSQKKPEFYRGKKKKIIQTFKNIFFF